MGALVHGTALLSQLEQVGRPDGRYWARSRRIRRRPGRPSAARAPRGSPRSGTARRGRYRSRRRPTAWSPRRCRSRRPAVTPAAAISARLCSGAGPRAARSGRAQRLWPWPACFSCSCHCEHCTQSVMLCYIANADRSFRNRARRRRAGSGDDRSSRARPGAWHQWASAWTPTSTRQWRGADRLRPAGRLGRRPAAARHGPRRLQILVAGRAGPGVRRPGVRGRPLRPAGRRAVNPDARHRRCQPVRRAGPQAGRVLLRGHDRRRGRRA